MKLSASPQLIEQLLSADDTLCIYADVIVFVSGFVYYRYMLSTNSTLSTCSIQPAHLGPIAYVVCVRALNVRHVCTFPCP